MVYFRLAIMLCLVKDRRGHVINLPWTKILAQLARICITIHEIGNFITVSQNLAIRPHPKPD